MCVCVCVYWTRKFFNLFPTLTTFWHFFSAFLFKTIFLMPLWKSCGVALLFFSLWLIPSRRWRAIFRMSYRVPTIVSHRRFQMEPRFSSITMSSTSLLVFLVVKQFSPFVFSPTKHGFKHFVSRLCLYEPLFLSIDNSALNREILSTFFFHFSIFILFDFSDLIVLLTYNFASSNFLMLLPYNCIP